MFLKFIGFLLVALLSLTACAPQTGTPQTESGATPSPGQGEGGQPAYPGIEETPVDSYPGPDTPVDSSDPGAGSGDETYLSPQPGDELLTRSTATVDLENSEMLVMESYPVQIAVILRGYLPNPCHKLRAVVSEQDAQNNVQIEVYSVVDPEEMCIEVIEEFEIRLPLGSYQGGTYQYFVNGELLGEVDT